MPITNHITRSSMISEMEYDSDKKLLTLNFNGSKYEYKDVSEETYKELINAESIGKYFLKNIKGKYEHERI